MKQGDVVFFKHGKRSTARKAPEVKFKGYGFGVMLGHVPPFAKDPPPEHLLRLMGQIGFVSFDDVGEILGEEMAQQLIQKFEDKYYGKQIPVCECVEKSKEGDPIPELNAKGVCTFCEKVRIQLPKQEEPPAIVAPQASKLVGPNGKPILMSTPENEQ